MAKKKVASRQKKSASTSKTTMDKPKCGLCGKSGRLTLTECCGQVICDDEGEYVMFSFARNSCHRNHSRYTLCSFHFNEGHTGDWRECDDCKGEFETELYVSYGTNEYNFVKLANPPKFKPTKCAKCKKTIRLGEDGYSISGGKYFCERCTGLDIAKLLSK